VVHLNPGANGHLATARVHWLNPTSGRPSEAAADVTVSDLSRPFGSTSPRLRVTYAAAFFAEVLRDSPYGRDVRLGDLSAIAREAYYQTGDAQVADLADLIERASDY
jgi:Ca-activated chloride channel family protein